MSERVARRAVLFDLDGTLADTAPDLAQALNRLLAQRGRPALPFAVIRPHASHGSQSMVKLGFGLEPGDPDYAACRAEFLALYAANLACATTLFPGMRELLEALESAGIPWGIVTNKPAWLTDPLLTALGLDRRAACVVSGDTAPRPKPHPDPILHACRQLGLAPGDCWMLGDAERDIAAGLAAGTRTLAALFGYLDENDDPASWGADGLIREPVEALAWLLPAGA